MHVLEVPPGLYRGDVTGAESGVCVAHSEAPGITVFTESAPGVYDAPQSGPYAQRLVLGWDGETLSWGWHWAPRGEPTVSQSLARVRVRG